MVFLNQLTSLHYFCAITYRMGVILTIGHDQIGFNK
jgi:hypothetical protein